MINKNSQYQKATGQTSELEKTIAAQKAWEGFLAKMSPAAVSFTFASDEGVTEGDDYGRVLEYDPKQATNVVLDGRFLTPSVYEADIRADGTGKAAGIRLHGPVVVKIPGVGNVRLQANITLSAARTGKYAELVASGEVSDAAAADERNEG